MPAYLDDVRLVGKPDHVRLAVQTLQGPKGAEAIGLHVQPRKCAVTGRSCEAPAALAVELDIQHSPNGVTTCGTPIGTDAYITEGFATRAASVESQVDMLLGLALPKQFVLVRASLALHIAHLKRTIRWKFLARTIGDVEL